MESATIHDNGKITLPLEMRQKLNLKDGDKIDFVEQDGEYKIVDPIDIAIKEIQDSLAGIAEEYGWKTEEDVIEFCRQFRKERSKTGNNA
ncbi:MAG: AbrB/MazE/SpoVT family DNA-binding domain-containing protein [Turicibacter sp.]|nr:AbrB/MazE/SpoVT family DNA-binding domain-containing protein [Turicibacter sp.]